jgi:hypothetical protein
MQDLEGENRKIIVKPEFAWIPLVILSQYDDMCIECFYSTRAK